MNKLSLLMDFKKFELDGIEQVKGGFGAIQMETHAWSNCGSESEDYEVDVDKDGGIPSM